MSFFVYVVWKKEKERKNWRIVESITFIDRILIYLSKRLILKQFQIFLKYK